ncbi:Aste57867_17399 [Aphanomyces stellatus]|uniref:Aste57867_17399 protein n=1 Tax=Aphanomyces stellatus TaxID=120398 RepID=A0A485L7M0_9STRA|nr:hypothetical protein As57867_017339 [Aphanomyces stellatus]VFT94155.1 Aste57867_17399 [Aphanomyces stellatus]
MMHHMIAFVSCFFAAMASSINAQPSTMPLTLLGSCPLDALNASSIQAPDATICLRSSDGNITTSSSNGATLSLSNGHIVSVQGFPQAYASIDLSMNAISTMSTTTPGVVSLNLSGNVLTSMGLINLPTNLVVLDLSNNAIDRMDGMTFDFSRLTKLTTLKLGGNNLRSIRLAKFPPSLTYLDISNNALLEFEVEYNTYVLMNSLAFTLVGSVSSASQSSILSKCMYAVSYIGEIKVCITNTTSIWNGWKFSTYDVIFDIFLAITTLTSVLYISKIIRTRRTRAAASGGLMERDTFISSACDDCEGDVIQYRASLTPVAATAAPNLAQSSRV